MAAATITVNTQLDELSATDGHCSLREAVTAANTDTASGSAAGECAAGSGTDTIQVPAGTYKLTILGAFDNSNLSGDIDINSNLTIVGAGAATTKIDAAGLDRAFDIEVNRSVTLQGLTITGGRAPDGSSAPVNSGQPGGPGESGGGIRNAGTLTVIDCVITSNASGNGGSGGAAVGADSSTGGVAGGQGMGGGGGDGGDGGGVSSSGPLTLIRTSVIANITGSGGSGAPGSGGQGGPHASGGEGVGGSGGAGGSGGGVFSTDTLTANASTFSGNVTGNGGQGAQAVGGNGGAGDSTTRQGGAGGEAVGGGGGAGGEGGGLSSTSGLATLTGSSFASNSTGAGGPAGSAEGGAGGLGIPSVFSGIASGSGGAGGQAIGGIGGRGGAGGGAAIRAEFTASATLTASGDTFDSNTTGNGGVGGAESVGGEGGNGGAGGSGISAGNGGAGGTAFGGVGGDGGAGGGLFYVFALPGVTSVVGNMSNDTVTGNAIGAGGAGAQARGGNGGNGGASGGSGGNGGEGAGGDGGSASGGGALFVSLYSARLTLLHATATSNTGNVNGSGGIGQGGPGGLGNGGGNGSPGASFNGHTFGGGGNGGIYNAGGSTSLENSIVAANGLPSCAGTVVDGGHDIVFPDHTCPGVQVDPKLGALADNGGPTETQALSSGSPAIDAVPSTGANCAAADQRGVKRPHGAACDIGAYERAAPDATTGTAAPVTTGSATLQAQLNPNDKTSSFHFELGTTATYGTSTSTQSASGVSSRTVSATVSGLTPNTLYHFRIVASNGEGTTNGADKTFTTAAVPLPSCVVPKVVGKTLRRAKIAIRKHHCRTGKVRHRSSAKVKKGRVIAQKPRPRKVLPNGAKVRLVVSRGPRKG